MKIDYKKAYEDLKDYLMDLKPYCDNCDPLYEYSCDECHRKYFNWHFNESCLEPLSKYEIKE